MKKIAGPKILGLVLALSLHVHAQGYKVINTWKLGGDGGWDYLTVDSDAQRVFIARSTRVMVVDTNSGKLLTEIPDTLGVHGVALVPEFGRGFISDGGEDMVSVFDLKTLKVLNKVKVGTRPDAIIYDPFTKRVFTFNARSSDTTAVNAEKGEIAGTLALGGKPEYAVSDGKGTMWVNIEDTSELVAFDPQKLSVKSRWKMAGCEEPTGLAFDAKNRRLFAGCSGSKKMDCGRRQWKSLGNASDRRRMRWHRLRPGCKSGIRIGWRWDNHRDSRGLSRQVQRRADRDDPEGSPDDRSRRKNAQSFYRHRQGTTREKSGAGYVRGDRRGEVDVSQAKILSSSFLRDQSAAAWTKASTRGCGFFCVEESWG